MASSRTLIVVVLLTVGCGQRATEPPVKWILRDDSGGIHLRGDAIVTDPTMGSDVICYRAYVGRGEDAELVGSYCTSEAMNIERLDSLTGADDAR